MYPKIVSKSSFSCLFPECWDCWCAPPCLNIICILRKSSSSLRNHNSHSYLLTIVVTVAIAIFIFCTSLPLTQLPGPRVSWLSFYSFSSTQGAVLSVPLGPSILTHQPACLLPSAQFRSREGMESHESFHWKSAWGVACIWYSGIFPKWH